VAVTGPCGAVGKRTGAIVCVGAAGPVQVVFDGQAQFHLAAIADADFMTTAILPNNAVEQFRKSQTILATLKGQIYQFNLTSTGQLAAVIPDFMEYVKNIPVTPEGSTATGRALLEGAHHPHTGRKRRPGLRLFRGCEIRRISHHTGRSYAARRHARRRLCARRWFPRQAGNPSVHG
jgi:hypothetical protein